MRSGVAALLLAGCFLPAAIAKNVEKPMFKDKYVKVNGVRLHCVTAGKGPLILFLHGFPEFWYEWKDQLPEFGKDHLAVAPDMRGYNLSDKPSELDQYRVNLLVEDIRALGDHFSHQK
jgi:pimeloyl-ACP methyl ester carboxylesterase